VAPSGGPAAPVKSAKASGKQRAFKRTTIEVPRGNRDSEDSELGDEDTGVIEEFGAGASFLQALDEKGISRCAFPLTAGRKYTISSVPLPGVSGNRTVCIA
jgi:hypothetical protein